MTGSRFEIKSCVLGANFTFLGSNLWLVFFKLSIANRNATFLVHELRAKKEATRQPRGFLFVIDLLRNIRTGGLYRNLKAIVIKP